MQQIKALGRKLVLPCPSYGTRPSLTSSPLVIAGMFRTGNGIGRAARYCHDALRAERLGPVAVDISRLLNQADLDPSLPLAEFPPSRQGTLILFANPPELELCLWGLGLRRWHNWRIAGAWAWESSVAPANWKRQARFVSEIWAPSQFCADAFEAYGKPVQTIPHFVRPVADRTPSGRQLTATSSTPQGGGSSVQILTLADARSSLERKNPVAAVRMFRAAFPDNMPARLTLKCRGLGLYPDYRARLHAAIGGDPRIDILDQTLSDAEQAALLDRADIILSPHRSEGFGLSLAEAMARGKCVVATGWSGNLAFMSRDCAMLLPYRLVPLTDPTKVYPTESCAVWAEPDLETGARMLRALADDPAMRASLGQRARLAIADKLRSGPYRTALEAA